VKQARTLPGPDLHASTVAAGPSLALPALRPLRGRLLIALAAVVGVSTGILMGRSRFLASLLDPLFSGTYAVPKLALFPIFIFVFGIGSVSNLSNGYPWGVWITIDVVIGTAIGAFVFATIQVGLILSGVPGFWFNTTVGILLVLAVLVNNLLGRFVLGAGGRGLAAKSTLVSAKAVTGRVLEP